MVLLENLHHISLGSSNLARSIEFYRDTLDFEVIEESGHYALLLLEDIRIRINLIENFKNTTSNPGAASLSFILDVDDFSDAIEELEENNITIIKGPVVIEHGESILIADPDGNLIELFYQE